MASVGCAPGARRRSTDRSIAGLAPAVCLGDASSICRSVERLKVPLGTRWASPAPKHRTNVAPMLPVASIQRNIEGSRGSRTNLGPDGMPDGLDLDELADEIWRLSRAREPVVARQARRWRTHEALHVLH